MKKIAFIFICILCLLLLVACQVIPEKQPVIPSPTPTPTSKPSPVDTILFGTQPTIEFQTPEPTVTPTPTPKPTPMPIPTVNRDNELSGDLDQNGTEETITVTYTNAEYTVMGEPLNLKIEVNDVVYAVDDSSLNLPEDFYISHTDFFLCDVDNDGKKEIVFGFQQMSNLPNEKIVVFKYINGTIIQLSNPMTADLKFNCTGDKYMLYLDGVACKEFPLDERVTYGKEYQYKADSYELRVENARLEEDKLKITFYFYESNDDLDFETITAIFIYQNDTWKIENIE